MLVQRSESVCLSQGRSYATKSMSLTAKIQEHVLIPSSSTDTDIRLIGLSLKSNNQTHVAGARGRRTKRMRCRYYWSHFPRARWSFHIIPGTSAAHEAQHVCRRDFSVGKPWPYRPWSACLSGAVESGVIAAVFSS